MVTIILIGVRVVLVATVLVTPMFNKGVKRADEKEDWEKYH